MGLTIPPIVLPEKIEVGQTLTAFNSNASSTVLSDASYTEYTVTELTDDENQSSSSSTNDSSSASSTSQSSDSSEEQDDDEDVLQDINVSTPGNESEFDSIGAQMQIIKENKIIPPTNINCDD